MSWQFMPHAPEMRSAQAAMLKSAKAPNVPKVPGYTATGLYFKKHGREVLTLALALTLTLTLTLTLPLSLIPNP